MKLKQLFIKTAHYYSTINLSEGMVDKLPKTNGVRNQIHQWQPQKILTEPYTAGQGHACLILNREIKIPAEVVIELWENAAIRCCVDGGSNRWLQFLKTQNGCNLKLPDLITGDFDSITAETMKYFDERGIRRIHTPDQNHTDFSKAVDIVKPLLKEKQLKDIIVFHDTSGRFDQIMSNINTLFTRHENYFDIYLLSSNSLTWLLKPDQKHSITIPAHLVEEQRWCSLIPIGHEATNVTTQGLKWNLTRGSLFFGGMVSSSNTYAACRVDVETNFPLVWSMGVFSNDDD